MDSQQPSPSSPSSQPLALVYDLVVPSPKHTKRVILNQHRLERAQHLIQLALNSNTLPYTTLTYLESSRVLLELSIKYNR